MLGAVHVLYEPASRALDNIKRESLQSPSSASRQKSAEAAPFSEYLGPKETTDDENSYHYLLCFAIELERNDSIARLLYLSICQPISLSQIIKAYEEEEGPNKTTTPLLRLRRSGFSGECCWSITC